MDWDNNKEITHQLLSWTKQTQHMEINVIYCLLITDQNSENYKQTKITIPINSILPSPAEWCGEMKTEGCVQSTTLCLFFSFLTFFHCSSMEYLPHDTVLPHLVPWEIPSDCSPLSSAPTCIHSTEFILQEETAPACVSHKWKLTQASCSTLSFSPWAIVLAQSLLLWRFSMACSLLQDTSTMCAIVKVKAPLLLKPRHISPIQEWFYQQL